MSAACRFGPVSVAGVSLRVLSALLLSILVMAVSAKANDSTAVIAADGIRLQETAWIRLKEEVLRISPEEIRIHYVFRSPEVDQRTIVAFPLPVIPFSAPEYSAVFPEPLDTDNPLHFRVTVDGQPIRPNLQAKALINGVDFTPLLERYGIRPQDILDYDRLMKRIMALPPAARKELEENGLISKADIPPEMEGEGLPPYEIHWDLSLIYWWWQTFPAGRDVQVEHVYVPVAGSFFFSLPVTEEVRRMYCTDRAFLRGAARMMRRHADPDSPLLLAREVHYILSTARNWADTIGHFRLIIDKGRPDRLVSLCWRGLKKVSPTRFVFEARDFEPTQDLKILFLEPMPK